MLPRPRLTRRRLVAGGLLLALVIGVVAWIARPATPSYITESPILTVRTGPDGLEQVALDTTYYRPRTASAAHPVPAVLLAHGFGGTKDSVASDARDLAGRGYAVMTWTAEGFGRSGGQVHMDSPDWEVTDARRLLDWLAARPEVRRDAPGDPRVAAVGGSYGGALALLLAGSDRRVDAIVPQITWNDLASAFLPESTGAGPLDGVFKRAWAGQFFGSTGTPVPAGRTARVAGVADPACGRFALDVCHVYLSVATTGRATPDQVALLRRSSPATVLDRITAPTLLIQGQADSLFPLSEADANARGIATTGTPVRVAWYTGGHDGGQGPQSDRDRLRFLTMQWLDHYLLGTGSAPGAGFTYSRIAGIDASTHGVVALGYSVASYPGVAGQAATTVAVSGPPQPAANPPNGTPGALSSLPRVGGLASRAAGDVPGQHADFYSAPLRSTIDVVGAPSVRVRAASPTGEAVLFLKLYDVDPKTGATLPDGLVAPVHLTGLPASIADARPATVTLPAIVHEFQAGHLLRVTAATSDQAFATPPAPAVYSVAVGPAVYLPTVRAEPIASPGAVWRWILAGLVVALAVALAAAVRLGRRRHRRADHSVDPAHADTPLVVEGLRKEYADGFVAISRVDLRVERGQVWRSTGRPAADAGLDEVLDIAGLGDAVHRRVRTYSHGMKQRLAVAQAMLGRPELLVLDEPTDGLDPPQIAEMRRVLRRYATGGRAVLVSSHLLAEVEQTCTHVVVVHRGEVAASGPVDEIVGDSPSVQFDVSDPVAATEVLRQAGVSRVAEDGGGTLVADLDGTPRAAVVAALVRAGIEVHRVVPRRRLEDAFLALVGGDRGAGADRDSGHGGPEGGGG